jgi:hypothetical protein
MVGKKGTTCTREKLCTKVRSHFDGGFEHYLRRFTEVRRAENKAKGQGGRFLAGYKL